MKKILLLSNDFMSLNFRKELVIRLLREGHRVYVSMVDADENRLYAEMGCKIIPAPIDRRGINPFKDIKLYCHYKAIFKEIRPDIIFSYTIKPNIYGSLASRGTGCPQVCNITGTGGVFLRDNLISELCKALYRISVKKARMVFFQNEDDKNFFVDNGLVGPDWKVIPGSGCNLKEHFFVRMPKTNRIRFMYIGRILALKGIDEYLRAARTVKSKYPKTEFFIAGYFVEPQYRQIVQEYEQDGVVKHLGFCNDIDREIRKSHCIVLPSKGGEGIPNALLEGAAIGRACIGSDIPGARQVIDDNVTGFLFRPESHQDLVNKMEKFLSLSYEEMARMGINGRQKVEREFDREQIVEIYLNELGEN